MVHRKPARMRLPPGYARLKDNLGQIIRAHRLAGAGTDEPLPPKVFAHRVGISRVALSRIEHDRAWPRSETLVAIMDIFMIDWPDVADPGVTRSPPRQEPDTLQDLQRDNLCRALRGGGASHWDGACRTCRVTAAYPRRSYRGSNAGREVNLRSLAGTRIIWR